MRLLEPLGVSVLVELLAFSREFSMAISSRRSLSHLGKPHVLSELLGSSPVVVVIPQVDEQVNNLFLGLSPGSVVVQEKHKKVLVEGAIVGVHRPVELWCVLDPMIVDVKERLFELEPR